MIEFTVLGRPQPAGSKRAFPIKRANGATGVAVTDANPRAADWKDDVRKAAKSALGLGPPGPFEGPLALKLGFFLRRPKGHFGTGRNAGKVKTSAPLMPTTKPDTTKLIRAVEDALTGIIWRDDSQVVSQFAEKHYTTGQECCYVQVRAIPAEINAVARMTVGI